jgi:hypothetical protein
MLLEDAAMIDARNGSNRYAREIAKHSFVKKPVEVLAQSRAPGVHSRGA